MLTAHPVPTEVTPLQSRTFREDELTRIYSFEAPYLIDKLIKEHIFEHADDARLHFRELKRWLVACQMDRSRAWDMYSRMIDEVWHQFALFTRQYVDFSIECFGHYIHHAPGNSPDMKEFREHRQPATIEDFAQYYANLFDEPLPDAWYNDRFVKINTRLINNRAGQMNVRLAEDRAELVGARGAILVQVNPWAKETLDFLAKNEIFFVREMPGKLRNDDRVALAAVLMQQDVLRLAP
ncbi:hypothetical protein LZC95_20310 [Pendulispora brunnea]|uniref:Uncharacterized protein n=1 Tax=Pendulispora brunnea TaxID=2905690 RepID=A0ABZ2KKG8_9BACT